MWSPFVLIFYAVVLTHPINVLLAQLTESNRTKEHINIELGPLIIHLNTTKLPPEAHPLRWDDKHAKLKATVLLNFVKDLPELNPFNGAIFGPYDASIPDLHFDRGNLTFENVSITGIKEIIVQNVNMQLTPIRVDLNVSIPDFVIEADFDLDTIFDKTIPIQDRGHLKVSLLDMDLSAVFGPQYVQLQTNNAYQLETAVIDVDIKNVQLQMDTFYGEEVKLILDEFFKQSQNIIVDNDVFNMILKAINQELAKIPAKKIVFYFLGTGKPNLTQFGLGGKRRSGRKHAN